MKFPSHQQPSSLGQILQDNAGVGPGFDFVRLMLAFSIVLAHSYQISTGAIDPASGHPLWMLVHLQVPMFFALSGFLVAGSAARLSLGNFLLNRIFRIYPALMTEIVLSIFIIGVLFTKVDLYDFFVSKKLALYLTNLVGLPHYTLPSVFEQNPLRYKVNGSLWTVPYELACYLIMSFLVISRILHNHKHLLVFSVAIAIFSAEPKVWYYLVGFATSQNQSDLEVYLYENLLNPYYTMLFAYFCFGVAAYQWRDRIPYSAKLFAACVVAVILLTLFGLPYKKEMWFKLLTLPIGVYLTVFMGLTRLPLPDVLKRGDYSYGIYLYGFPVQQAVQSVIGAPGSMWLNFGISAPIIFLWARFSWRFVEKPALALRKRIPSRGRMRLPAPTHTTAEAGSLST